MCAERASLIIAVVSSAALAVVAGSAASAQGLPSCSGGSTGLVLAVQSGDSSATLERGGSSGALQDLSMLCPGDRIVLGAGQSANIQVQGGPAGDQPLQGPVTYQVPSSGGVISNATVAVANVLFPEDSGRTRTLVSRSDGARMTPRPESMSARLPQELTFVAKPRAIWFGWTGGAAPFHATLETSAGEVLASEEITALEAAALRAQYTDAQGVVGAAPYDVTFAPVFLTPGDYKIRVFDANSEEPEVAALMSDDDAGVLSLPLTVSEGLDAVPLRSADEMSSTDLERIVEAACFSFHEPRSRLFEAAQHVVNGRTGAPYAASLTLLGDGATAAGHAEACN